ncbi:hypothetical protein ILUMI_21373 [Ignelater luminosus]|uniref:HTH CENPB-type domain-containing protein n=1 Tax=Ignelater luminosus TaxID=2038154 RepID=A0A8K0G1G8_IGNLU|nr:hypothetical protein ILUMI_21373 [Ignelater luminosus]
MRVDKGRTRAITHSMNRKSREEKEPAAQSLIGCRYRNKSQTDTRKPLLGEQMEKELVGYLLQIEEKFYGLTLKDLRRMAFQLASRNSMQHPFKQGEVGRAWVDLFLQRHKQTLSMHADYIASLHESGRSCISWSKPQEKHQEGSSDDQPANLADSSSSLISSLGELQPSSSKAASSPSEASAEHLTRLRTMASWSRSEIRAVLRYNFVCGLSIDQCLEEMTRALNNDCPHRTTIFRWFREFQRGNFTLEDAEREGKPRTSVTEENITAVRKMLDERHTSR